MIFEVTRTSEDEEKPCEEAFEMKLQQWATRTCTEKEFDQRFSAREGNWRSKGKNHARITPQMQKSPNGKWITRQLEDKDCWVIKIETLAELLALQEKYDDIILKERYSYQDPDYGISVKEIEIYDDYRE